MIHIILFIAFNLAINTLSYYFNLKANNIINNMLTVANTEKINNEVVQEEGVNEVSQEKTSQNDDIQEDVVNSWWEQEMNNAGSFAFDKVYPLKNKIFWVGKGGLLPIEKDGETVLNKCIIHVKTNLVFDYNGNLLGRTYDDYFMCKEDLESHIIQWCKDCGVIN